MSSSNDILLLRGDEVHALLKGREREICDVVATAYRIHASGNTTLPHSSFLHFTNDKNRIIALPAYLGGNFNIAGLKWIASFPDNTLKNLERASAVLVLNSYETGFPFALMEGSVISSKRTAASAAVAANLLKVDRDLEVCGVVGCGLISFETVRFLLSTEPKLSRLLIYDLDSTRASTFKKRCSRLSNRLEIRILNDMVEVFRDSPVTIIATTASKPHIFDISMCPTGSVILHLSLRDLSPETVLASENVVDDVNHVFRAQTSVHLAEQKVGGRDFVRCTLGEILNCTAPPRGDPERTIVFSPFGLGVLDLAVGSLTHGLALSHNVGTAVESFAPTPWSERE